MGHPPGMEFADSLTAGPHGRLAAMHGTWRGRSTLWFEPGEPHAVDAIELVIVPVAGGRSLRIDTETTGAESTSVGELLLGYHLDEDAWQAVWSDSFHTGTALMQFAGAEAWSPDAPIALHGSYAAGPGVRWGWHVTIQRDGEELVILHENVEPDGQPTPALEWRCHRAAAV